MPTAFTGYITAPSLCSQKPPPVIEGMSGGPHTTSSTLVCLLIDHASISSYITWFCYLVLPPQHLSASALPLTHCPPSVTLNSLQYEGRWKSHDRIPQRDQGMFQAQGSDFRPRFVSPPHEPWPKCPLYIPWYFHPCWILVSQFLVTLHRCNGCWQHDDHSILIRCKKKCRHSKVKSNWKSGSKLSEKVWNYDWKLTE